jgi:hypothetical protein
MKAFATAAGIAVGILALAAWALCAIGRELGDYQDPCLWPDESEEL